MFNNEYPYTNIHEINLDWIIKNVEEIRALVDKYIINYEQITFADPIGWEYAVAYPMHTIVLDQSYNAYLSKQDVPSYTQLGDSDYWLKIGDFFQYIEKALSNIAYNETTSATASKSYAAGDLLVSNDILYRVTIQLPAGSTFVIGTNIEQITVEDLLNELKSSITNLSTAVSTNAENIATNAGNIAALQTSKQDALTFDATPTENSTNPVTSGGVYSVIHQAYGATTISHVRNSATSVTETTVLGTVTFNKLINESRVMIWLDGNIYTDIYTASLEVHVDGNAVLRGTTSETATNTMVSGAVMIPNMAAGSHTVELKLVPQAGATATAPAYSGRYCALIEVV